MQFIIFLVKYQSITEKIQRILTLENILIKLFIIFKFVIKNICNWDKITKNSKLNINIFLNLFYISKRSLKMLIFPI